MEEVEKCHAAEVRVWKEIFRKNEDSPINNVKAAKVNTVKISVERN